MTRSGVKRIGSGMQKLQRRMGRTYQSGWDRAKSNVNRQVTITQKMTEIWLISSRWRY